MSTKKKTTKSTKAKRTAQWNDYFKAAITGFATSADYDLTDDEVSNTEMGASIVKRAEKIADIATARNA